MPTKEEKAAVAARRKLELQKLADLKRDSNIQQSTRQSLAIQPTSNTVVNLNSQRSTRQPLTKQPLTKQSLTKQPMNNQNDDEDEYEQLVRKQKKEFDDFLKKRNNSKSAKPNNKRPVPDELGEFVSNKKNKENASSEKSNRKNSPARPETIAKDTQVQLHFDSDTDNEDVLNSSFIVNDATNDTDAFNNCEENSNDNNSGGVTKKEFNEFKIELLNLIENKLSPATTATTTTNEGKSKLHPTSSLYVNSDRLKNARDSSTGCAFISRLVTAVASVEEIYRVSCSGQDRSNSTEKKQKFDDRLRKELELAARHYYPQDNKLQTSNITRAIGNKLRSVQNLLKLIREEMEVDLKNFHGLTEFDLIDFKNFASFRDDPSKFNELDNLID